MPARISTQLRDDMLGEVGLKAALKDGIIDIYSGAQPASADDAITGTLLATITESGGAWTAGLPGNGLEWGTAAAGAIAKAGGETWKGNGLVAGVAGWARFKGNAADDNTTRTDLPRYDMPIGKSSGTLKLSTTAIAVGVPVSIDTCTFALRENEIT